MNEETSEWVERKAHPALASVVALRPRLGIFPAPREPGYDKSSLYLAEGQSASTETRQMGPTRGPRHMSPAACPKSKRVQTMRGEELLTGGTSRGHLPHTVLSPQRQTPHGRILQESLGSTWRACPPDPTKARSPGGTVHTGVREPRQSGSLSRLPLQAGPWDPPQKCPWGVMRHHRPTKALCVADQSDISADLSASRSI